MHRSSLVDREHSKQPPPQSLDFTHPIASCFRTEIERVLQGPILPHSFGTTFHVAESPLYVSSRQDSNRADTSISAYSYENTFYSSVSRTNSALICPVAREGVGKSTFVRFFFDCYMHHIRKPVLPADAHIDVSSSLVLYSNLQAASTADTLRANLFRDLKEQIRRKYPRLSTVNDYAMWSRLVDWDDPIHDEAEASYASRSSYRADTVGRSGGLDAEKWASEAIWYLSSEEGRTLADVNAVIIILDNVDQLEEQLQLHVINLCRTWITTSAASDHPTSVGTGHAMPLKVIVPLRPETLEALEPSVTPVPYREIVELGSVVMDDLLDTRKDALRQHIADSDRYVELDGRATDSDTTVFSPISPEEAADEVARMLTYDIGTDDRNTETVRYSIARRIIDELCDGSTRRSLTARWRIVNSIALQKQSEPATTTEDKLVGNYSMLCALIVGNRKYFFAPDPTNLIVNLYNITEDLDPPYSTLLGVHFLHVIRTESRNYARVVTLLSQIGYRKSEIDGCFRAFAHAQIITACESPDGSKRYEVNKRIAAVHSDLMRRAAYIDNMAMVTPVEYSRLEHMSHTVPYSDSDFIRRAETSLEFLEQLQEDENDFCKYRGVNDRVAVTEARFQETLDELALPSAYRVAALGYRKRLEGIKADRPSFVKRVGPAQLDALLNSETLRVNDDQAAFPLVSIP